MTGLADDVIFDLVGAIPVHDLYPVVHAPVEAGPIVEVTVPHLALKGKPNPHMRRAATVSSGIIGFDAFHPHILGEHDADDAIHLSARAVQTHIRSEERRVGKALRSRVSPY